MPSFDIVSKVDEHELDNAVNQANRELEKRFDFRGVDASFELEETVVTQRAPSEFQLDQMLDILRSRVVARGIDLRAMETEDVESNLASARRRVSFKQGIEKPVAKKIIAQIKDAKLKVTTQIVEDKLRVIGKKRDELQATMSLLKKNEQELPLQFENFRD